MIHPHLKDDLERVAKLVPDVAALVLFGNVKAVFLPGAGAQTIALMLKEYWKTNESLRRRKMPLFFALAKKSPSSPRIASLPPETVVVMLRKRIGRRLQELVSERVMVLDDCCHTEATANITGAALESLGFKKIKKIALVGDNMGWGVFSLSSGKCLRSLSSVRKELLGAKSRRQARLRALRRFRQNARLAIARLPK